MDIYWQNGFKNRREYLEYIADEYGIDTDIVISFSSILGEEEDFGYLLSVLNDYAEYIEIQKYFS